MPARFCCSSRQEREEWIDALQFATLNCNIENKYEVDRSSSLGSGSFSTVWKIKHRKSVQSPPSCTQIVSTEAMTPLP